MEERENRCSIIAEYENAKNIPDTERCTEYVEEFGTYMFRLDVSQGRITSRHAAAKAYLEGRVMADGKKVTAIFRKTITGNIQDAAKYTLKQEEEMLQEFYGTDAVEKKLGVCIGEEEYMLLRKGKEPLAPPEMLSLPFALQDARYMERLDELRSRWYIKLVRMDYERQAVNLREAIEASGSSRERMQSSFNYTKEIKVRMKSCDKVFMAERMEGYDFREVDLQNAIFIGCQLANSNFAHCNMENVFFFQCDLTDCDWYGAFLNGCTAYYGGELVQMQEFTRKSCT